MSDETLHRLDYLMHAENWNLSNLVTCTEAHHMHIEIIKKNWIIFGKVQGKNAIKVLKSGFLLPADFSWLHAQKTFLHPWII